MRAAPICLSASPNPEINSKVTIDFGSVEEVDSHIPCCFDTVDGELFGLGRVGVEPVAIGDDGDFDSCGAEVSVLHIFLEILHSDDKIFLL